MKRWFIPVTWEMCAVITVEAETLDEALETARDDDGEIPLPMESADYVDGSWHVSVSDSEYIRQGWNDGQKDEGGLENAEDHGGI